MLGVGTDGERLKKILQEMSQKLPFGRPGKEMSAPQPLFLVFICLQLALIFGQVKI